MTSSEEITADLSADATPPTVQAAAARKAALTSEAPAAEDAVQHARAQAPRGRTERPTTTAG